MMNDLNTYLTNEGYIDIRLDMDDIPHEIEYKITGIRQTGGGKLNIFAMRKDGRCQLWVDNMWTWFENVDQLYNAICYNNKYGGLI